MKRSGFLNERINIRMTSELKEKLDTFAREFDVTTAVAARFALYELTDTYEKNKELLHYYDGILQRINEMYMRDGTVTNGSHFLYWQAFNRLERAFQEGFIKKNYKKLPKTREIKIEVLSIYEELLQLDKGEITKDIFLRRIRHYLYGQLIYQYKDNERITPEEIEKKVDEELKKLLG